MVTGRNRMFDKTADLYDAIYAAFKDYAKETAALASLLQQRLPLAKELLDVACGTGEHARLLAADYGYHVDGIDLDPGMIDVARAKNPAGRFAVADMTAFDLGRQYDAVLCLFSSIGYVRTLQNVVSALRSMKQHLRQDGIIIVEPWFEPTAWRPGHVAMNTAHYEGTSICRMSRALVDGRISIIEFEYLIGSPEGIRRASEVHELGLFTVAEMLSAFDTAGLRVTHDPVGLMGRGLYVATAP